MERTLFRRVCWSEKASKVVTFKLSSNLVLLTLSPGQDPLGNLLKNADSNSEGLSGAETLHF